MPQTLTADLVSLGGSRDLIRVDRDRSTEGRLHSGRASGHRSRCVETRSPSIFEELRIIELEQVEDCSRAGKVSRGQMEETSSPGAMGASVIFNH